MPVCTVLVVDDDRVIREVLTELLAFEGYAPLAAADGQQAVTLITASPPDVILLDLELPGLSGRSVAHEIEARGWEIPIIVLSAAENARHVAQEIKARACLLKPFDVQTVFDLLFRICPTHS